MISHPVRILIAEDHPTFAYALMLLLECDARVAVVGVATNGVEVVELASIHEPDVVLMDIAMPLVNGVEATRRLLALDPKLKVLILSGDGDGQGEARVRQAGAVGFFIKGDLGSELVDSILSIAA